MEAIVELLLELVLQVIGEVLTEFGVRRVSRAFDHTPSAWAAAIGYAILGAFVGFISILVVPALLASPVLRVANLIVTPLVAGATASMIGSWRHRRGQELVRLDRFAYGYLFALSMAIVRFWLAK